MIDVNPRLTEALDCLFKFIKDNMPSSSGDQAKKALSDFFREGSEEERDIILSSLEANEDNIACLMKLALICVMSEKNHGSKQLTKHVEKLIRKRYPEQQGNEGNAIWRDFDLLLQLERALHCQVTRRKNSRLFIDINATPFKLVAFNVEQYKNLDRGEVFYLSKFPGRQFLSLMMSMFFYSQPPQPVSFGVVFPYLLRVNPHLWVNLEYNNVREVMLSIVEQVVLSGVTEKSKWVKPEAVLIWAITWFNEFVHHIVEFSSEFYPPAETEITEDMVKYAVSDAFKLLPLLTQCTDQSIKSAGRDYIATLLKLVLCLNGERYQGNPLFVEAAEGLVMLAKIARESHQFRDVDAYMTRAQIALAKVDASQIPPELKIIDEYMSIIDGKPLDSLSAEAVMLVDFRKCSLSLQQFIAVSEAMLNTAEQSENYRAQIANVVISTLSQNWLPQKTDQARTLTDPVECKACELMVRALQIRSEYQDTASRVISLEDINYYQACPGAETSDQVVTESPSIL